MTAVGNTVQFIDTRTGESQVLAGRDGGGIGSICVHPTGSYFVVAEKGIDQAIALPLGLRYV